MTTGNSNAGSTGREDLFRYLDAGKSLESTQAQLEALEESEAVETFHSQMALLQRRLLADPQAFRDMFIADGTNAIVWEFKQPELGADFIKTFWNLLLRDDDTSKVLMRFVWNVPLGLKRKFVRAIDQHLSDRYPMFKGLSEGWPAESFIPPYIRSPEERSVDFGLVNQGYLGYMNLGYSAREVDLIVTTQPRILYEAWYGYRTLSSAICDGLITLEGQPRFERDFPRWFARSPFAARVQELRGSE